MKSGDDSWWHYLEENEERAKFLAERAFTVTLLFKQLQVYLKREKQSIKYMYFTVDVNKDPTTHSKLLINQARANVREKIKERCQNLELAFKCTCEATTESVHFMVIDDSISPTTAKCQLTSADQTLKESHLSWFVSKNPNPITLILTLCTVSGNIGRDTYRKNLGKGEQRVPKPQFSTHGVVIIRANMLHIYGMHNNTTWA